MPDKNYQELRDQVDKFKRDLDALTQAFYANNFLSSQDFNKNSRFNNGLKVPHYSSEPSTCEVGQIIEVGGILEICAAADTWEIVGTQV